MMDQPQDLQAIEGREANSHIFFNGDGYYYHVRERRTSRARLKCRHYSTGCHGTASVNLETGVLRPLQPHTCQRDLLLPQDLALRREMVTHARENVREGSVRQILRRFKLRCNNPALASRFTVARMHSALYEARSSNFPRIPRTLSHLGVLLGMPDMEAVCRTIDGQDYFFRGVCGAIQNKSVSVIFASGRMLHFLRSRRNLHVDGTFKKRPKKPKSIQILNIVTNFNDTVIPLVRVLMTRRTEVAYDALLERLRNLAPGLNPTRLHSDFERGLINSLRRAFPDSDIAGCLWHYAVASSSKARKLGIAPVAAENDIVHTFVRCIGGAPLLPAELIEAGVDEIWVEVEASGWAHLLGPLFDYFRREWLPRVEELSVYGCPERTNNLSESDNHTLGNVLPQNRPNIWRVVSGFGEAEHLAWCDKLAVEDGRAVNGPRRWRVIANDAHVLRMTRLLIRDEITPGRFLHGVSYAIQGAVNYGLRNNNPQDSDSDSSDNNGDDGDDDEEDEEEEED